jgi:hypothetical protein
MTVRSVFGWRLLIGAIGILTAFAYGAITNGLSEPEKWYGFAAMFAGGVPAAWRMAATK